MVCESELLLLFHSSVISAFCCGVELISEAQGIGDSDDYRSKLSTFLRLCNNRGKLVNANEFLKLLKLLID